MSAIRRLFRVLLEPFTLVMDLARHLRDESHTSRRSTYRLIRRMYWRSKGRTRRMWRVFFRLVRPPGRQPMTDPLGIAADLAKGGYATCPGFIDAERAKQLREYFEGQLGWVKGEDPRPHTKVGLVTTGLRFNYTVPTVLGAPGIIDLVSDPAVVEVAREYLGCQPIFTAVHAWWSLHDDSAGEKDYSSAAQRFHFDADWTVHLRYFLYLTDVTEGNGPFSIIEGSHLQKPVWHDGRFSEEELFDTHGLRSKERRLTGQAGTLICADTIAYHRGTPVEAEPRLVLMFEYAASRLGNSAAAHTVLLPRELRPPSEFKHTFDVFASAAGVQEVPGEGDDYV